MLMSKKVCSHLVINVYLPIILRYRKYKLFPPMSQTVLELKNAAIYQRESLILSEVDVTINKGDFVYLIGKTGTGKVAS
jgi:ABC-type siderophore export system fused ATPase/permease subunit